jgi:hypothetical protein
MEGDHKKPIYLQFKQKIAEALANVSGLTPQQALESVEDSKSEGFQFSLPMMKLRRYKVEGDPLELAKKWSAEVR